MAKNDSFYQKIVRALKKHDLFYKMFCLILIKCGFSNDKLQALQIRYKKMLKTNKKYLKYFNEYEVNTNRTPNTKDLWVCWFQGIDNAPYIVKKCYESLKKNNPDKEIHIITEENMFDYVQLPEHIVTKWKKGIISYTHLSDILRTELLINHGGIWIDATSFFTDKIPNWVYKQRLFMFEYYEDSDVSIKCNSWFIYADKDNNILKSVRDLLYKYWEKENHLSEYFLWHLFMTLALDKYPKDYHNIYKISDSSAHMLQCCLLNKYDENYYNLIKKMSFIHKLTYKLDFDKKDANSYYDTILK